MSVTPFRTVVADPPWSFRDKLPGAGWGAVKHYETMRIADLCKIKLPPIADDAWLFLWRVASQPRAALDVCEAWGFVPKTEIVWCKVTSSLRPRIGMGHYVRNAHEVCVVAIRGRPERLSASVPSWFMAERFGHSVKPDDFYDMVEELAPAPRVELFARRHRPGWVCIGDEVGNRLEIGA